MQIFNRPDAEARCIRRGCRRRRPSTINPAWYQYRHWKRKSS